MSTTKDPKRTFSRDQKRALIALADNQCENCGTLITMGTCHADHVLPWSLGGETTIKNGRALCAACNLKKGNNMLPKIKDKYGNQAKPREWQKIAFGILANFIQQNQESALLNVCPGGGKTMLGQMVAKYMLGQDMIDKVIIISPRAKIRSQWERGMTINGIPTSENLSSKKAANRKDNLPDRGLSLSYHLLSNSKVLDYVEGICLRYRTLIIMDEIHWTGSLDDGGGNEWGKSLVHSTRAATFCLALSGTPFREDHYKVPFLTYEDGQGEADYNYDYGEALIDGVVTPLYFTDVGGSITFKNAAMPDEPSETLYYRDGVYLTKTGEPDTAKMNKRLTMSLLPGSEYWKAIMDGAIQQLNEIRENRQPNAAGIVFAVNQNHARAIASYIAEKTGANPSVIISSEDTDIDSFATSNDPWVVSVKMISEGVDIERLRVAAFLSNTTTRKFFMQAIARIIRLDYENNGPDAWAQAGFVWYPQDPRLIDYAREFKKAVIDHAPTKEKRKGENKKRDIIIEEKDYTVDSSENEKGGLVFGEEYFTPEELDSVAEEIKRAVDPDFLDKVGAALSPQERHVFADAILGDQRRYGDSVK